MAIRREPTYLSTEVWRALWLLAKADNARAEEYAGRLLTADEIADQLLRSTIQEKYPQLLEHQKKLDKLERETIASLK